VKCAAVPAALVCLLSAVSAQGWLGPFQLSSSQSDDVNPSACKEFLTGDKTCLVWQRMTTENWDIFSRFGSLYDGSSWSPETRVTVDSVDDVNPAVACLNDWQRGPSYWCVWEHRVSHLVGSIRAAFVTFGDSWGSPVELGPVIHTDGDSAMPGIITINGTAADTVWVAWRNHDTSGTYVRCVHHAGVSWSSPEIAVAADLRHARLGRYDGRPVLVWEQSGDIWYSVRDSSGWATPAEVAPSDSADRNPDVVSNGGLLSWLGASVVWESTRDGDTAAYITEPDSFSVGQRACRDSAAGTNRNPAGANFVATTSDLWWCFVAWVSDRNGNPDIYTSYGSNDWDYWVDLDSADDLSPVVTSMTDGMGAQMAWVLWQSNRHGDWDIFGGYVYNSGIEESPRSQAPSRKLPATVVRSLPDGAVAFDAMGRRVLDPKPGAYFVRDEGRGAWDAGRMRKVIIQR